ncbi:MAG: hypothetical protein J1F07_07565 [Muribaculaceae bacterium]|nr:hypothetical protein [Muribaculaceae bacterium]
MQKINNIIDYIDEHNAKCYDPKDLIRIAIRRLQSKPVVSDGILFHAPFFKRFFTADRVGDELQKEFTDLIKSKAEKIQFATPIGTLLVEDIRVLIIIPEKKSVELWTTNNTLVPVVKPFNQSSRVKVGNISKLEIAFSEQAKQVIYNNKANFKALSDLIIVLSHLCPEVILNTSKDNTNLIFDKIKELPDSDEDLILLNKMVPDIIEDVRLIYDNLNLYWGS